MFHAVVGNHAKAEKYPRETNAYLLPKFRHTSATRCLG
jgi:hypothetical protein